MSDSVPGPSHDPQILRERIAARAYELGLDLFGVVAAGPVAGYGRFLEWTAQGRAGEMEWMGRSPERRSDPRRILPSCRSVIVGGMLYRTQQDAGADAGPHQEMAGIIARYARGDDYHDVLKARLMRLLDVIRAEADCPVEGRVYVDTGALLERDLGYAAGLGWRARNTHLIHPQMGSYFFLGEILVDLELKPDEPLPFRCGSCHQCMDACPTRAFVAEGVLDARRCISYLTIELRGPIPRDLRPLIGSMVFGCDICQEVCPWNRKAPLSGEIAFQPRPGLDAVDLIELMGITREEFSRRFRNSAIKRTKRRGLIRNVAVALGNSGDRRAVSPLADALEDPDALIRGHAAWALGRLGGEQATAALDARARTELVTWVAEEIQLALSEAIARSGFPTGKTLIRAEAISDASDKTSRVGG